VSDTYAQTANGASFRQTLAGATGAPINSLTNVTGLEFGFTAFGSSVSFQYILASEEYTTTFPCTFADQFALLIREATADPNNPASWTNLAVLPNGNAVSVTNIHPGIPNSSCTAPVNGAFFGGYNPGSSHFVGPDWLATSNFNGQTVPLTATHPLVPGTNYVFRLLIADFQDTAWDSAVFIKGDWDIDLQLGNGSTTYPQNGGIYFAQDCVPNGVNLQIVNANPAWVYQDWTYSPDNVNYQPIPGTAGLNTINTGNYPFGFGYYQVKFNCTANPQFAPITMTFQYINNSNVPLPTVSITQPSCTLATGSFIVTAPLGNYEYSINGVNYQSSVNFNNLAPGTYQLIAKDMSNNCLSSPLSITINAAPLLPNAGQNAIVPLCLGTPHPDENARFILLGPNAQTGGTWTGPINNVYTYTVSSVDCGNASATVTINEISIDTPVVTTTPATCSANGTATITNYNSAWTYTFNPVGPTVGATGLIGGLVCGTNYTVTATNGSNCTSAVTPLGIACQLPTPAVPTVSTTAATCSASGSATVSNYDATLTYTSTPAGINVGAGGVISGFTCGTPYTITATNASTCFATSSSFTIECQLPTISPIFTQVAPICAGATLSALPPVSNNGVTGTWSPALNNQATTTYTFTPTKGLCATTQTMTIVVNPNVVPAFTQVAPICLGATLSALPPVSNNGVTGTWSPALNNQATTTYTFTPTAGQCATTTTISITVIPNNTVSVASSEPTACINTDTISITHTTTGATGIGVPTGLPTGVTASWSNGTITISGIATQAGTFNYSIPLIGGCGNINATGLIAIGQCQIPQGISPNNDGKNDVWDLEFLNARRVEIFNRYGMQVYSRDNYRKEFGGISNDSQVLPDGTYFYIISLANENKSGWLYINRERK
jgi:gliding motility-associated-like protein